MKGIKNMKLKIVDKAKYQLLERIAERTDNYISQIKTDIKKIDSLNTKIEELEKLVKNITILFQEKEKQRRKNASKIGGLQTSLNKEKNNSKYRYFVSDDTENFEKLASSFLQCDINGQVAKTDIEKY